MLQIYDNYKLCVTGLQLPLHWRCKRCAPILFPMTTDIETLGLLDDDEIELDHAALVLSELDHDGVDLEAYYGLIAEIGARLEDFVDAETPEAQG